MEEQGGMMKNRIRGLLLGAALVFSAMLPIFSTVAAAENDEAKPRIWIQVSPVSNQLTLDEGQKYDGKLKVTNVGADTFDFRVYTNDYFVTDLDYEPIYEGSESTRNQIVDWTSFDQTEYKNLEPGASIEVPYHIAVPDSAPGGSQYAVLFAEVVGEEQQQLTGTAIQTVNRVGSLLFAKIRGETQETGELASIDQNWLFFAPPVTAQSVVKNTGNVDFAVHHTVTIKPPLGDKEIYKNTVDKLILPETSRKLEQKWEEAPFVGLFRVENQVKFLDQTHSDFSYVLIAPLWLLITAAVILLLIIVIAVRMIVVGVRNRRLRKAKSAA
ncbi:MAG: hypothetical protein LBC95_03045 [Candidatus Nomurabacteria bacterium]|jgi:hypothetical protein|nr:hypothetical protein [Candidatus Nomurabacteria bacterium]